jgi:hypothetical protein
MRADTDPRAREARRALEEQLPKDLATEFESLFPVVTGWGVAKRNRKRMELLNRLAPVLRRMLAGDEVVTFVAQGTVNLWWEQLFMGAWAQAINRTALVLTSKRLLMIHLHGNAPKSYVNQVSRGAIKKIGAGIGSLSVKLGSGSIVLSGVPGVDKKALKQHLSPAPRAQGGRQLLCPKCYSLHMAHTTACARCHAGFKSPWVAALRSGILPGLGDFYLGHHLLASFELLGSAMLWLFIAVIVSEGLRSGDVGTSVAVAAVILVLANGTDAALTHAQAKKGLMAMDGKLAEGPFAAVGSGYGITAEPIRPR